MGRVVVREWRSGYLRRSVRVWVSRERFYLLASTQLGCVYAGAVVPFVRRNADGQRSQILQHLWSWPMKRKDLSKMKGSLLHAESDELKKVYPNLAEWMTAATFEGSKDRREAPTVTIWATGGQWRASLKDRAEGLVLWLSAGTLVELLDLAEAFVLSAEAPWRHDDTTHERNGKRVKK